MTAKQTAAMIALGVASCAILAVALAALILPGCYWPPPSPPDPGDNIDGAAGSPPGENPPPAPAGETADAIDEIVATILPFLGPLGAAAGVLYGRIKPARTIRNMVTAVQNGRNRLKAHAEVALTDFDDVVRAAMDPATAATVRRVKKRAHLRSVTHGDPPPPDRPEKTDPMDTD